MANVEVVTNAVVASLLTRVRDQDTGLAGFRAAAGRLGTHLASRAADRLPSVTTRVQTPLAETEGRRLPGVVAVPVLRAGLGLLPGVLQVFPEAAVGMIGLARNEETYVAEQYYRNVPDLEGQHLLVLEPMLATGGSASDALALLSGAISTTVLSIVATQVAVDRIMSTHPHVSILTAAIDPELDDNAYIVPGLGDFGDRLWGTT